MDTASPPRVAYQGEPGAFSEAAALAYFGPDIVGVPRRTFEDVAHAVASSDATFGMLPVENTLAGAVAPAYDALAASGLVVTGEITCFIRPCLLGVPGAARAGVRRARSHPVALAQCARFFRAHPDIEAVAVHDTAGAARQVAGLGDPTVAAVAGRHAAEVYGLDVLEEDIQDRHDNQTRFFVITRPESTHQPDTEPGPRKTALLVETKNRPGALLAVLQPIAERGINLTHLESRPGETPWTYRFFLEFEADADDDHARDALVAVRSSATSIRVLGTFRSM